MASKSPTTLIVGAGVFGTSTAYHLSKVVAPSSITVIDRHEYPAPNAGTNSSPYGASHDINKIVRADYTSPFYMKLAYEAISVWDSWDVVKPFYHRSGWIMLDEKGSDLATRIRKNFKESGHEDITKDLDLNNIGNLCGDLLIGIVVDEFGSAYANPGAGWAEADKAVAAVLDEAVKSGVKYRKGEVSDLLLNENANGVRGVKLQDGSEVYADTVLLATAAWTGEVLESLEDKLGLDGHQRLESQATAAGTCVTAFQLDEDEKKSFERLPILVYGDKGDLFPSPPSGLFKINNSKSFSHNITTTSGRRVSRPPKQSQNVIPDGLREETMRHIGRIFPSILANGRKVDFWRLCWDLITPQQHAIISRHPDDRLENLYLAVGGSFHSWKFLPIIGKYITNVLQGKSNGEECDKNWAWKAEGWDTAQPGGAHAKLIPKRDLKDLGGTT